MDVLLSCFDILFYPNRIRVFSPSLELLPFTKHVLAEGEVSSIQHKHQTININIKLCEIQLKNAKTVLDVLK